MLCEKELHSQGYSHCDIKLENIIIDNEFQLKFIDLAHMQKSNQKISLNLGTETFQAPEVKNYLSKSYVPEKVDIYNLGYATHIIQFDGLPNLDFYHNDTLFEKFC